MRLSNTDTVESQTILWTDKLIKANGHQLLKEFNNTIVNYPKEKTITDLFESQAVKNPDAIALCRHEQSMTYGELNKKANQLARYLIAHGVKSKDNIGLMVARSFDMIIGMLAIMKTGAAYVPNRSGLSFRQAGIYS